LAEGITDLFFIKEKGSFGSIAVRIWVKQNSRSSAIVLMVQRRFDIMAAAITAMRAAVIFVFWPWRYFLVFSTVSLLNFLFIIIYLMLCIALL
jgi:hypothetical protein